MHANQARINEHHGIDSLYRDFICRYLIISLVAVMLPPSCLEMLISLCLHLCGPRNGIIFFVIMFQTIPPSRILGLLSSTTRFEKFQRTVVYSSLLLRRAEHIFHLGFVPCVCLFDSTHFACLVQMMRTLLLREGDFAQIESVTLPKVRFAVTPVSSASDQQLSQSC